MASNSFRLLDLPREIRDLIYHSALVSPTGGRLRLATTAEDKTDKWSISEDFAPNINLMCSCKQIKMEAQSIFYKNNTFIICSCVSPSSPDCFPGSFSELLKSVELQYTISHCRVSGEEACRYDVHAESLLIEKAFRMQFEHNKELVDCWSAKAQLTTRLPSLQDLTVNVADPTLQKYARIAQLWIISVSRAQLKKRQEKGLADCRLHVTGLLLQDFDWFLQVSYMNTLQEEHEARRSEIEVFS